MEMLELIARATPYLGVTYGIYEFVGAVQSNAEERMPWETFWEGPWWRTLPPSFAIIFCVAMWWFNRRYLV